MAIGYVPSTGVATGDVLYGSSGRTGCVSGCHFSGSSDMSNDAASAGHRIETRRCHFSGSPEHDCGQRVHTCVDLGLGSAMPLQRVIGSDQRCHFSGSSDQSSAVPLRRVTGTWLSSTSPHLCGSRAAIGDATSAGHRIGPSVPLSGSPGRVGRVTSLDIK